MPLQLAKILLHFQQSACRVHPLLPIAMIDRRIPPHRDQTLAMTRVRTQLEDFIMRVSQDCPRERTMSRSNSNLIVRRRLGARHSSVATPGRRVASLSHLSADIAFKPVSLELAQAEVIKVLVDTAEETVANVEKAGPDLGIRWRPSRTIPLQLRGSLIPICASRGRRVRVHPVSPRTPAAIMVYYLK